MLLLFLHFRKPLYCIGCICGGRREGRRGGGGGRVLKASVVINFRIAKKLCSILKRNYSVAGQNYWAVYLDLTNEFVLKVCSH